MTVINVLFEVRLELAGVWAVRTLVSGRSHHVYEVYVSLDVVLPPRGVRTVGTLVTGPWRFVEFRVVGFDLMELPSVEVAVLTLVQR
jgi:hypothetical protein